MVLLNYSDWGLSWVGVMVEVMVVGRGWFWGGG